MKSDDGHAALRREGKAGSPPAAAYGADNNGLICGYLFDPGRPSQEIGAPAAAAWLSGADPDDPRFLWLHFNLAHAAAEKWLRGNLALSEAFFETLHAGSGSTRIEHTDDALVAVINDVAYQFSFEASELSTLWATGNGRILVTVRRQPLRSIEQLRASVRGGESFRSPLALIVHLLRDQSEVLEQIVRDIAAKVDGVEDRMLAGRADRKPAELGALRRVLVKLRRLLAPDPSALFRLLHHPPEWVDGSDIEALRQSTEEFSAVLADMSTLQERIKLLQEEIAAQINEQTNRSVFMLTTVTVLALPINLIAGLLGMNVGGIPFGDNPAGFWIVVAIVASFTGGAAFLGLRGRR